MAELQTYLLNSSPYMKTFIQNWYFILPLSLALMFGYKFMPKIIIILTGFVVGFSFLYPYLLSFSSFSDFIEKAPSMALPVQVVLGVVSAAAFWGLFKMLGFLGGFLILGFLAKAAFDIVVNNNSSLQNAILKLPISIQTFGWLVFIAFGIIGGIIVLKKTDEAIQFLSVLVGSALTAFYTLYEIEIFTSKGNIVKILNLPKKPDLKTLPSLSQKEILLFLFLTLIYIFVVYYVSTKMAKSAGKRKEQHL